MNTEKIILWNTKYGYISCCLKNVMQKKHLTIYQLCRLTNLRYEVIEKYYNDNVLRYDANVLSKMCYSLDCKIDDLLQYEK